MIRMSHQVMIGKYAVKMDEVWSFWDVKPIKDRLKSHIEQLNGTTRQRISRLIRKTLLFSKEEDSYEVIIRHFFWPYNLALYV